MAYEYRGLHETRDNTILNELLNVDPAQTEWCAAFVNSILEEQGIPSLNTQSHPYPLSARSFLRWGEKVSREDIQQGDVVVFPRGPKPWLGHVGFYYGKVEDGRWIIIGGNQANMVRFDLYNPSSAVGIRRWNQ